MLTTISMIRIGKTYGNLMVDVHTGSEKQKDRAVRIVSLVTDTTPDEASDLLKGAKWNVKAAIVMKRANVSYAIALRRIRKADDSIREALGEDLEPRLRALLGARTPPGASE
jgi:N-acetylmuramic acid 6-phosphate etherase